MERIVLLVLNELSNEPHNECFRLFASRQRVRKETLKEVNRRHTADWSEDIWSVVFGLQDLYELEDTTMNQELTVEDVMKLGKKLRKQAIATATPKDLDENQRKQVIATATLKELNENLRNQVIASVDPKERLAGLAPEERLAGLAPEERLAGISPDEIPILLAQIEAMLSKEPTKHKPSRPRTPKKK